MIFIDSMLEKELDGQLIYFMKKAARSAIDGEEIGDCGLCITVVSPEEIRRLNSQFRGKDSETDVLSFPSNDLKIPLCDAIKQGFSPELEDGKIYLGDIAICADVAKKQADEYGNTFEEEMSFLTVHGCLHLLGYDHERESDERIMREKQRIALGRRGD